MQVGRENPSELKAQKLARSVTRGLVDRDLKPDVEEKRQIDAILLYPPNRCTGYCFFTPCTLCNRCTGLLFW